MTKPSLHTVLSPALLDLYPVRDHLVVVIDVLRATSTIATALAHGAQAVIPVDSVARCIQLGQELGAITAGERDGKIAPGLRYGNSPFEYPRSFIEGKTLVLTTTNGTKLLHMALARGATQIVTGAFSNLDQVAGFLNQSRQSILLCCAAWKDRVNIEDLLLAGALVERLQKDREVSCDSSKIAASVYGQAKEDLFGFMQSQNASHFQRLMGFGLEKDIRHCFVENTAEVLPIYRDGKLVPHR